MCGQTGKEGSGDKQIPKCSANLVMLLQSHTYVDVEQVIWVMWLEEGRGDGGNRMCISVIGGAMGVARGGKAYVSDNTLEKSAGEDEP